jgi:hypothetical protein
VQFFDQSIPSYAVLSHSWRNDADEVTFRDPMRSNDVKDNSDIKGETFYFFSK